TSIALGLSFPLVTAKAGPRSDKHHQHRAWLGYLSARPRESGDPELQCKADIVSLDSRLRGNERRKEHDLKAPQPQWWRMTKPYPSSVTLSMTIFLNTTSRRLHEIFPTST